MPERWFLATSNRGKVEDWQQLLAFHGIGLGEIPHLEQVEEDGHTAEDNAILKVRGAPARPALLADDVGLWVDALGGEPGLFLKRWAMGLGGWPEARRALGRLAGSRCEFRCGVALLRDGQLTSVEVRTRGRLCVAVADRPGVEPCFVAEGSERALPLLDWSDRERFHYRHRAFAELIEQLRGQGPLGWSER